MAYHFKPFKISILPALIILMFGLIAQYILISHIASDPPLQDDFISFQDDYRSLNAAFSSLKGSIGTDTKENTMESKQDVIGNLGLFKRRFDTLEGYVSTFMELKGTPFDSGQFVMNYMHVYKELETLSQLYSNEGGNSQIQPDQYLRSIEASLKNMYAAHIDHMGKSMNRQGSKDKTPWIYASLLLIVFLGVALIALNSRKVRRISRSHQNKEDTLEHLESRLAALELARDGIVIIDKNNRLMLVNKAHSRICGLNEGGRDQLIGKDWHHAFSYSDAEVIEEDIFPELLDKKYWVGEFPIYRGDGSVLHTELSFTLLPDGGILVMAQDISNIRKNEDERKALEAQFHQAQKMEAIGRLAGGFAHDFNNILAAMNGFAEFLVDDLKPKTPQHEFASNILSAGQQGTALIDQMLAFSRQGNNAVEVLNIVHYVEETLSMVQATISKKIDVLYKADIDVAPIHGNTTQISQLIMNLCVNAQDAIDDDAGQLGVSIHLQPSKDIKIAKIIKHELPEENATPHLSIDDMAAGQTRLILGHISDQYDYVKINISDTGIGMSRVTMERIFEPFFTTKSVDRGTGLGLSTVHGVVLSHQGCMIVDSTIGKGTVFTVYLPLAKDAIVEKSEPVAMPDHENQNEKHHILLVEDQDNVRDMTVNLLSRLGYQTSQAISGIEGLKMIKQNPTAYDLVITDQNMPKMTGVEMVQQVYLEHPDIPFILLSGYSLEKIQDIITEHKAIKAHLKKPISKADLSKILDDVLEQKSAA